MYKAGKNRICTEWPQTELEHLTLKSTLHTLNTYSQGPNFGSFRSTVSRFRDTTCTRSAKIGNAPNDPKLNLTLNSQKYAIYTMTYPLRSKFSSVLLYDQPFPRYKIVKNRKCTEWSQTALEYLTVKCTLYALHTYSRGPNFGPFCSTICHFWDTTCTRSVKIGNAPNDPKLTLNT